MREAVMAGLPGSSDGSTREFRADPGAHWPAIGAFAALALLSLAGVVWLSIKPGPVTPGRVVTALFLAVLGLLLFVGARRYWFRLQRRFRLQAAGVDCFDGRRWQSFLWGNVSEIYETISSVRLLGVTVDAPQLRLAIVTTEGLRCEIDNSIQGSGDLAANVSDQVNRRLSDGASRSLQQRRPVMFGCLSLSESGIVIAEAARPPWHEALQRRFESQVNSRVVVPGDYEWQNIRDVRVAQAVHGSRVSDHTRYHQLEIHAQGRSSPVYVCAILEFPNFAVFVEVLRALGRSLNAAE